MDRDDITRWRKANKIKQSVLAEMLGVTQGTVSKWENGSAPLTRTAMLRFDAVVSEMHQGQLAIELAYLNPQHQAKLLVQGRGLRILGVSKGFLSLWPGMNNFVGLNTRDFVVNEAAAYCEEKDYLREAEDGELLMVTSVSNRLLGVGDEVGDEHRIRWHAIARKLDGHFIHEVIYEPCPADTPVGFERILRRSDFLRPD